MLSLLQHFANSAGGASPGARRAAAAALGVVLLDDGTAAPAADIVGICLTPRFCALLRAAGAERGGGEGGEGGDGGFGGGGAGEQGGSEAARHAVAFFDADHATPTLVWNSAWRRDLKAMLARELGPILELLQAGHEAGVGPATFAWEFASLRDRMGAPPDADELKVRRLTLHREYSAVRA